MLIVLNDYSILRDKLDAITQTNRLVNCYQIIDLKKIQKAIVEKECYLYSSEHSCVVFCPFFDFFDVSVYTTSHDFLKKDLEQAILSLKDILKAKSITNYTQLKFAACCKIDFTQTPVYKTIEELNFETVNSIARYTLHKRISNPIILELVPEEFRHADFAQVEDAQSILDLMYDYFNPINDSMPELSDIIENIKKKQVVCVWDESKNHKVIAFHYFEVINNIYYGLFDCTDVNYRKGFVFNAIVYFMGHYQEINNIYFSRSYGWRDLSKGRLNKLAKKLSQTEDGVVIYNYKYSLI